MAAEDEDRFDQFKDWFRAARDHSHKEKIEDRLCYDFVAGNQWDEPDSEQLKLQNRPPITFNRTGSVVDSVCGLEVSNRQEVRYIPRQLGAAGVNDLLTAAAKWVRDECNAEDEESDAFMDLVICGKGWTETRIDYDEDPQGKLLIVRTDPMTMYVDATSRRRNYVDAKHQFCVKQIPIEDAEEMLKEMGDGVTLEDMHASWADADKDSKEPHDAQEAPFYRNDQSPDTDKQTRKVTLVEIQWWEKERAHRVVDPTTGKAKIVSEDDFATLQGRIEALNTHAKAQGLAEFPEVVSAKLNRRIYKRAILGTKILKEWDGPKDGGFTYKCMTGKRDRNKGTWYGLVRAMIDPQKWANKWLSQVMHIINTNAKGGLIAESDAFENQQDAEESWAQSDAITIVTPGAIQNQKIQPKPQAQYPQGIDRLMQFAISSIRDVSGVNLELLGMANKDQPGILEHQRKQAGMTILAGMFDSLRHYRKEQGKLMLWYITNFLSDGRLIRIGGQDNGQYVPLLHQKGIAEYDVIVDDTPTSPNMKEQTWAALSQMFPMLAKLDVPMAAWMKLLEYSPLPSAFISEMNEIMQQQGGQPSKQQLQQMQEQMMKLTQENQDLKSKKDEHMGRLQLDAQVFQVESQLERERAQAQIDLKRQESEAALALQAQEAALKLQIERETNAAQIEIAQAKLSGEMDLKARELSQRAEQAAMQNTPQSQPQTATPKRKTFKVQRDKNGEMVGGTIEEG